MIIQVIGAGSWGLALSRRLALNDHEVHLWAREEDNPEKMARTRESEHYLPGVRIPESIRIGTEPHRAPELVVYAVPSHAMRSAAESLHFDPAIPRVTVAKGIENDTLMRMSEVIQQVTRANAVAALSGPSHAEEVGRDLPTTCVAASADGDMATLVQEVFTAPRFRIYTSHDIVGVEVGGSLKNVIAIAAGACDGLELGDNAKAALITRGMAEISRLGVALGADPLTFAGLSGIGDLIVTCGSRHSRNRSMGERIGKGEKVDDIVGGSLMVFEGVRTTKSAMDLSRKLDVPMPITEQVHAVLFDDADPSEAIDALMTRDPKPERV